MPCISTRPEKIGMRKLVLLLFCVLAATQVLFSTTLDGARAQTGATLSRVKRVYVASFGDSHGATELRDKLVRRLRKCRGIEITGTASEVDVMITGAGETWVEGYIRTSTKPSPYNRQTVYDGYLSLELRSRDSAILWCYLAKTGKWRWNDVAQDLVNRSSKKLIAALQ